MVVYDSSVRCYLNYDDSYLIYFNVNKVIKVRSNPLVSRFACSFLNAILWPDQFFMNSHWVQGSRNMALRVRSRVSNTCDSRSRFCDQSAVTCQVETRGSVLLTRGNIKREVSSTIVLIQYRNVSHFLGGA